MTTLYQMSEIEFQQQLARLSMKCGTVILCVCAVGLVLLCLAKSAQLYRADENRHNEALLSIQATNDIGQTAWAQNSVSRDRILRQQARDNAELKKKLKDTEAFMAGVTIDGKPLRGRM